MGGTGTAELSELDYSVFSRFTENTKIDGTLYEANSVVGKSSIGGMVDIISAKGLSANVAEVIPEKWEFLNGIKISNTSKVGGTVNLGSPISSIYSNNQPANGCDITTIKTVNFQETGPNIFADGDFSFYDIDTATDDLIFTKSSIIAEKLTNTDFYSGQQTFISTNQFGDTTRQYKNVLRGVNILEANFYDTSTVEYDQPTVEFGGHFSFDTTNIGAVPINSTFKVPVYGNADISTIPTIQDLFSGNTTNKIGTLAFSTHTNTLVVNDGTNWNEVAQATGTITVRDIDGTGTQLITNTEGYINSTSGAAFNLLFDIATTYPIGASFHLVQNGAGAITIVGNANETMITVSSPATITSNGAGSVIKGVKIDSTHWVITGDVA